ncbi:hypothetical protein RJ639_008674 [Escallonia herrerae]|uniref:Uncharacterized protein n=1 Tax=Escallonia herrerae TaxID=1293975 RepID=A0AA88VTI4_9ASTE|nr:hypothetical protein RJ639_008674 [Escallonia herrerae]
MISKEFPKVLVHDARNVKALYRRGQAYKELGKLDDAISDLRKAHEVSPDDETIAAVLRFDMQARHQIVSRLFWHIVVIIVGLYRDAEQKVFKEDGEHAPRNSNGRNTSQSKFTSEAPSTSSEHFQALKDDPQSLRSFQNFISQADPETLIALNGGKVEGISSDMVKTASNMISKMSTEELQNMVQMASSFQGENPSFNNLNAGSVPPEVSPDMLKSATDMMSKMSTEDMQRMFEMASSFRGKPAAAAASLQSNGLSHNGAKAQQTRESSKVSADSVDESSSSVFLNSRSVPQSSFPSSSADLQEQMRNQMNDPAMRQMKWADRLQRRVEGARKTKNWLLGRRDMILAMSVVLFAATPQVIRISGLLLSTRTAKLMYIENGRNESGRWLTITGLLEHSTSASHFGLRLAAMTASHL